MSKIRLIFGVFLVLVGLSSCRPREVLSRSEMADVLYDIHLTEAMVSNPQASVPVEWTRGMNATDFRDMAYQSVLKKHGLTEKTFYTSVAYYSKHLRVYSSIYAEVDKRLNELIKEVDEGKAGMSTGGRMYGLSKIDSVTLRLCNELVLNVPDTIFSKPFYLSADSIPSYGEWTSCQWMHRISGKHKNTNAEVPFSLILHTFKPATANAVTADTVIKTDTVASNRIIVTRNATGSVKKEIVALGGRRRLQRIREARINKKHL